MSNSNERYANASGWRFHAPIPRLDVEPQGSREKRETTRSGDARYSRSLARRLKQLGDGGSVRFQVGESRVMAMKIGAELFIRPFGAASDVRVNGVPATGMTRITWQDCLQVGGRSILLRRPRQTEPHVGYSVETLVAAPDETQRSAAEREREQQKKAGYRDVSRPPEAWGE